MKLKTIDKEFPLVFLSLFLSRVLLFDHLCLAAGVTCGQRQLSHMGLVIGGKSVEEADWPWHAAIFRKQQSNQEKYICGGSVLSENFILTAAHCTIDSREAPESFIVKLGLHNKSKPSEHSRTYEIVEVIVHVNFNKYSLKNDIALLRTEEDISYSDYIQPICLWPQETPNLSWVTNSTASGTVVGWGLGDGLKPMDILQETQLYIVDHSTCLKSNPFNFKKTLGDDKYCAGNPEKLTTVCTGDSGGGMYFQLKNVWYIRGLVSSGASGGNCNPQYYVTFMNIPNFLSWIVQHQAVVKKRNLLNLGNCGLDEHNISVVEEDKPVFLQYPWTAILEFKSESSPAVSTICNGALIHPQFVVTVGHCVDGDFMKYKLSVRLGEHNMKTKPDTEKLFNGKEISINFQSIDVEKAFMHPNFNKPRYDNNIAVLKLKIPADITRPNIKPICLPTIEDYNEANHTISGWKRGGQKRHIMTRDFVVLEDDDTCKGVYKEMGILTTGNHICGAYHQEYLNNCFHFMSGAPMQYVKPADRKNRYFLKGLFSFGYPQCQPNYTDVFTNINKYSEWIATLVDTHG